MSTIMASIDEEDVHEFNLDDDLDLLPIDSYDPIDVPLPAPAPAEVQANSRFLSEPASANRAPRFSNPTIERMNSFKYRNTPKENSTQASSEPTAAPIHDPRQIYQSSYNNVETRQRSAVPATALRKLGSPKSSESLVQKNISSPPQPPSIQSTPPARPPRPVTVAHVKVEEPRKIKPQPAVEVISTKKPVTPVPQVRSTTPTSQSRPSRISQPRPAQHIVSPTPAANIPEPQPVSVPPRDRSAPKGERVSIFKRPLPTTDLLSPIRTRNAVEASASATSSSRSTTPTSGRSLTPSSLRRSRLSVTNSQEISIAGTKSENGGGGWNSCVRVKGKTPVDDAIDNITRVKQESGEKAIEKPRRHTPLRSVGSLSQHDMSNVYPRNTDPVPVPSAQFFSPKIGSTSRSGTPTSSRPASRSTTPTIHSRPVSRSTTPTNVPQRRRPSLGSYMASDDMSEVSRGVDSLNGRSQRSASGRSPGRHTTPASASLLSPYNLMVAGNRTLDSHSMSDADLKSVGNQLLLLKLMLQHKATEDAAQDEEDILRAWQIVHATEEQARALSKHDVGVEEVEKVHQQIHDMVRII